MAEERRIQFVTEVDTTGAREGLTEIGQQANQMAGNVSRAGERAERAVSGIGNGAGAAATRVNSAERSLVGSIQRTTAQMQAGSRASAQYYEVLARQRGVDPRVLEPYLQQLRAVEQAQQRARNASAGAAGGLDRVGASAAQTANALRQVPAQLTDIVTSLQGGQGPLTVLLQQGGQLRDSFGSVSGALRGVGGQLLAMVNPYTIAAAAAAGLGLAYYAGSREARAYNLAIASTGNAAGTSAALMAEAAAKTADFIGSQGGAAEVLASMAATGQISSKVMVDLSTAALVAQRDLGREVGKTVEEYAALGKDPVKGLADLIDKYHHVTAATYAQVKALQDEGKTVEAVTLAQKAHADGINSQTKRVVENLGYIEAAWKSIKTSISETAGETKDWFLSMGRDTTLADLTASAADIQKNIDLANSRRDSWGARKQQALLDVLNGEITAMQKKLGLSQQEAEAEARKARADQLRIEITNGLDKLLSREELRTRALAAARTKAAEAGLSEAETKKLLAIARNEYKDVDEAAEKKREAAAKAAAEAAKQQAAQIAEMAGLTTSFAKQWDFLGAQYKKGAISLDDLVAAQAKLLAQQPAMKEASEREANALKEADEFNKRYMASLAAISEIYEKQIEAGSDQAAKNEELARTYGLTKSAIEALELARLEEQLAQRSSLGLTLDEIEHLEKLIEAKRRSAAALASIDVKDANKKAAEKAAEDWKRSAEQIGQALTDNLMRGGKSAAQYLKDLFRTLVLRPILQPVGNAVGGWITTAMGMPGAAQANSGGGEGGTNLAQSVSNMYNAMKSGGTFEQTISSGVQSGFEKMGFSSGTSSTAGSWGGQIGGTVGGYMIGSSLNKGISNGYETGSGFMTAQKIATAAASAVFGPIGGAVAGFISGTINRAFGMRPKEYSDTSSLVGSIGAGGFAGTMDTAWTQKGGWFRSDKSGVNKAAVDGEMSKQLAAGYKALQDASADFAGTLGINADFITNRAQAVNIALGKDEAANQKAIADFFIGVGNTIAGELLPSLASFQKEGEAASATLQRLATGYALVDTALTSIGMAFGAVGTTSLSARERLIEASGGLEAFAANTAGFQQNFLSEAERNAPVLKSVTEQLAAMGLAGVDTRDEFKQVILGLDLTTEAGAKQYGSLMKLQAAFAQVYPAIDQAAIAAKALADAQERANAILQERKGLQDELDSLVLGSAQLLEKQRSAYDESNRALFDQIQAVRDQKSAAEASAAAQEKAAQRAADAWDKATAAVKAAQEQAAASLRAMGDAIMGSIDRAQQAAKALREFNDSLVVGNLSALDPDARYREARKQFETVGDTQSMQAFLQASKDRGADDFYYQRDFAMVQEKLASSIKQADDYATALPGFWRDFYSSVSTPAYTAPAAPPAVVQWGSMSSSSAQQSSAKTQELKQEMMQMRETNERMANSMNKLTDMFDRVSNGGSGLVLEGA